MNFQKLKLKISDQMKNLIINVLKYVGASLLAISLLFSTVCGCIYLVNYKHTSKYQVYEEMTKLNYEKTKYELVLAVDEYIQKTAPSSCLNGISVVNGCLKHDIDICFVLAQGQIESQFGTQGMARKTNSVWNVLACDGQTYAQISSNGKYRSPDDSIDPYMTLLKKRYIAKGKTEYDLLHKYVDVHGKRYASAENYEASMLSQFTIIKNTTKIDSLSLELKRYSIILGY